MSEIINRFSSSAARTLNAAAAASVLNTAIDNKRASLVGVATPEGWDLFTYLGDPVGGQLKVGGGTVQRYQRGFIVERDSGATFVVYGLVADCWGRLGGPTGFVGLPTADQQVSTGEGSWATFDGADITWSESTGAHEVHGAIRDRWHALGGAAWAYPTNDESALRDGHGAEIGRVNTFPGGRGIYWSPPTGAWDVYGAIAGEWLGPDGGPSGVLGFPLSGETDTPDAGGRYNQFEHGVIVWHPDGPFEGPWTVLDLTLVVAGFQSSYDDIHVQVNIDVTDPTLSSHRWIPSDSDYESDPTPSEHALLKVPAVTPSTVMNVWMDGLGHHKVGEDERLGIIMHRYDITNLWGLVAENPSHGVTENPNDSYSFTANYGFTTFVPTDPNLPFRETKFWPYQNFTTALLTDADYAATYTDIPEGEEAFWHPFDRYFYNHIYKGSAANGNCYGMVLEALYAMRGESVFGEPVYDNPYLRYPPNLANGKPADPAQEKDDTRFSVPINVRHGYQFGAASHDWKADRRADGMSTDPLRVFRESKALHDAGELQLISVRFGDEGHAVLPYSWEENGSVRTIHIANPNSPFSIQKDDNDASNVIVITTTGAETTWSLGMGGDKPWTGGTHSGGEILYTPFSLLSSRPERGGGGDIFGSATNSATIVVGEGTTTVVSEGGVAPIAAASAHVEFGIPGLVRVPIDSGPDVVDRHPSATRLSADAVLDRRERRVAPASGVLLHADSSFGSGPEVYRFKRPLSMTTAKEARARAGSPAHGLATREVSAAVAQDLVTPATQPGNGAASREAIVVADPDPLLRWEIQAGDGANSSWALRSGTGSVIAEIAGPSSTDVIEIGGTLTGFPAITLLASDAAITRTATVTLVGPTPLAGAPARVITISGLDTNTAGVTMQLTHGGDTLSITNAAGLAQCSITLSSSFDPTIGASPGRRHAPCRSDHDDHARNVGRGAPRRTTHRAAPQHIERSRHPAADHLIRHLPDWTGTARPDRVAQTSPSRTRLSPVAMTASSFVRGVQFKSRRAFALLAGRRVNWGRISRS